MLLNSNEREIINMIENDLVAEEVEEALKFRVKQVRELQKGIQGPGHVILDAENHPEKYAPLSWRCREWEDGFREAIRQIKLNANLEGQ